MTRSIRVKNLAVFILILLFSAIATFSFSSYISAAGAGLLIRLQSGPEIGTAEGANIWTPNLVTIEAGDTITFTNSGGGFHNLVFDGGVAGGSVPDGFIVDFPSTSEWSKSVTFGEPGTYYFYCDPHFNTITKEGMGGRIVVLEESGGTVPTRTPSSGTIPTRTPGPTETPGPTSTPIPNGTATPPSSESQRIYLPLLFK